MAAQTGRVSEGRPGVDGITDQVERTDVQNKLKVPRASATRTRGEAWTPGHLSLTSGGDRVSDPPRIPLWNATEASGVADRRNAQAGPWSWRPSWPGLSHPRSFLTPGLEEGAPARHRHRRQHRPAVRGDPAQGRAGGEARGRGPRARRTVVLPEPVPRPLPESQSS